LNDLLSAYEAKRELIFHDEKLNADFYALRNVAVGFVEAVAQLTVTEGNPEQFTTRPRADRIYPTDESKRQSAEEAKTLDRGAKQLGSRSRQFVDDAKRRLRT
jgi:predicted ATPase